jgi:hypothetical protein
MEFVVRDDSGRINIQPAAAPPFAPAQAPDDIPVVRPAPQQAMADNRPAQPDGKGFKPFTFIVAVVWDPERRLRGELLARVSPYGLQLRDRDDREYHMPVGTRARYMGANRFMIDLGSRDLTLRVAKRNCKQVKLARHVAAFLNRQRAELRENDYLSAGAARWLALIPVVVVSLFFLPRGGNGWGIMLILAVAATAGLVNFLLLRSTRLSLRWRLGGNLGLWVLIAAGAMPLTYVTVRYINQQSRQPLSMRYHYARDGSGWQAWIPGQPDYRRKWVPIANGTMFTTETVELPYDRGKFEILQSDHLADFHFGGVQEALIYQQAIQDVQSSDASMRVLNQSEVMSNTGNGGKEFTFKNNSGVNVKMRVYLAKPRVYIMRVTWQGSLPVGEVDRFLGSLMLQHAGGPGIDPWQPQDPRGPAPWQPQPKWDRQPVSPGKIANVQLLACWQFDNDQGNQILDSSVNNQTGKLVGGWRIQGVLGNAIMLDGNNDYVELPNTFNLNFKNKATWTIAGWVATNQAPAGVILSLRNSTNPTSMIDVLVDNKGLLLARVRSDQGINQFPVELRGNKVVSDGVWHHFALVRKVDGSIELFQDGELVLLKNALETDGKANGSITSNLRALGCERWDVVNGLANANQAYFHGCLDEICVYTQALRIADIKQLAGKW